MPVDPVEERPVASEPRSPVPGGSGLEPNVAGALSYLFGAFTGVLFLVIDKQRPFVRFHAMQSIVLTVAGVAVWIALSILLVVLGAIPVLGWILGVFLSIALGIGGFVLWIYLMLQAFQGREWEIPVLGEQARKYAGEIGTGGPPPGS